MTAPSPEGDLRARLRRPALDLRDAVEAARLALSASGTRAGFVLATLVAAFVLSGWVLGLALTALLAVALSSFAIGWRRPVLTPPFLALLLPAGAFALPVFGVQAPLLEVALVAAGAGYLLCLLGEWRGADLALADGVLLALVLAVGISGMNAPDAAVWLHELAFWTGLALLLHCASRVLRDGASRARLVFAIAAVALFESSLALVEYIRGREERLGEISATAVAIRPDGTLEHANALGLFLGVAVFVVLAGVLAENGWRRAALAATAVVTALGIAVTFSRTAWLALAAGAALLVLDGKARRPLLVAAGFGAVAFAGLVATDAAFRARVSSFVALDALDPNGFRREMWGRAAELVVDHPLTGAATFNEQALYGGVLVRAYHPHNLMLGLAVSFGLLAAIAFALLLVLAGHGVWMAWRRGGDGALRSTALAVLAALLALAVAGIFEYPFWNEPLATRVVLLLSLAVAIARVAPPRPGFVSRPLWPRRYAHRERAPR